MFSNNNRISTRQVFRLFVFDFIGMSTLILPARLAQMTGIDGVFAILIGGGISTLYLWYLVQIMRGMDGDLITYVQNELPPWGATVMLLLLAGYCILEAAYGAYIFVDVMKKGLLGDESYSLLLILILAVAVYAIQSGIESRARVYEVLFWVLFIPLILLFLIAASDITVEYLEPFCTTAISTTAWGGMCVFQYLTPVFLILFFPAYVRKDSRKAMVHAVVWALWLAVIVFLAFYVILVGSFGDKAMAGMQYPALTLMSNIHLRGSFLKRLDVFLLAIWFFTLFALINVFLFYAEKMIGALGILIPCGKSSETDRKGKKIYSTVTAVIIVFILAEGFCYGSFAEWFEGYTAYVAVWLLILLPLVVLVWGKARNHGRKNG